LYAKGENKINDFLAEAKTNPGLKATFLPPASSSL
jgi:hypothetical protein